MIDMKVGVDIQTKIIELQAQILAAIGSAQEAKGECLGLLEENHRIKREFQHLQDQVNMRESMAFKDNVYWRSNGNNPEGPFCPKCLDGATQRAARMAILKDRGFWECPVCKLFVYMPGFPRDSEQAETDWDPFERM